MPEGNVVHHLARRLSRAFRGHVVAVDSPQGRFAAGAALVTGRVVSAVEAHGKHCFIGLSPTGTSAGSASSVLWIHVHLGLFGKWRIYEGEPRPVSGELRMRIVGDGMVAELRGATTCEVLDPAAKRAKVASIGPDPIRRGADSERAWQRVHRSPRPIGELLMDQAVFAGVGNIYRAEVLFRHGIAPHLPGRDLAREQFDAMWADLVVLMRAGVRRARIDTVRPEHMPRAMGRAARGDRHGGEVYVYRRTGEPCLLCAAPIATDVMQGRNLYWCPRCQAPS